MPTSFDDIMAKLDNNELWDFPGGVHPPQHKNLSNQQPIGQLPIADHLYVPLKQHIGLEGHVIVEIGQHVLKGQALTKSMNPFAVPIHAPTSGTIIAIGPHVSAHPSGLPEVTIEIESDKQDSWVALKPLSDYLNQPKMALLTAICDAGISGMGGAGFPTHIKSAPKKNVEFLIINGIECEPYISADDCLMREHAWQIRQGIDVLNHLLNPKQVLIGIEDNKPQAIEAMQVACRENPHYRICIVPTKYPAGGEKQLIQVLTNREVPSGGLPMDVGVMMHNVGTCFAIADAIFSGKPLIQRVVTLSGQALKIRGNYWTLIGTPIEHLLRHGEYQLKHQKTPAIIMGGPMMGFTVANAQVPVVKITNCILAPADKELSGSLTGNQEQACIRCGACADVCPASLLPQQLLWHAKAKELDKTQEYNLFDCIECGACAYVCPSEIPLVHYYRIAKAEVRIEQQEKQKADKARERFESRAARLIADQQARDEKHRLAALARKQAMDQSGNNAKDKIAAALARAKEKKQQAASSQLSADNTQTAVNAEPQPSASSPASNNERVKAAIARAKAKKAALETNTTHSPQNIDAATKQPARPDENGQPIALSPAPEADDTQAVAQKNAAGTQADTQEVEQQQADKQRKIAAAVAKAKAKRVKQHEADNKSVSKKTSTTKAVSAHAKPAAADEAVSAEQLPTETANEQNQQIADKKARIAAAVAKAKAKKAAEQATKDEN